MQQANRFIANENETIDLEQEWSNNVQQSNDNLIRVGRGRVYCTVEKDRKTCK